MFLNKKTEHKRNFSDRLMDWFQKAFKPLIAFTLRRKLQVTLFAVALFISSLFLFNHLGGEFIPQSDKINVVVKFNWFDEGFKTIVRYQVVNKKLTMNEAIEMKSTFP